MLLTVALAALLMLCGISAYPLNGDEYGSILAARHIGLSWNAYIYFVFMKLWARPGSSDIWLRIPSALFGILTTVAMYKIGNKIVGRRSAFAAGVLTATSPFLIYHSQQFRFYSFFIFATSLFIIATIYLVEHKKSILSITMSLLSGLVLILSHFFGFLAVVTQLVTTLLISRPHKSRWRSMVLGSAILFMLLLGSFIPGARHRIWQFVQVHTEASGPSEPVMAPLSLVHFVKVVWAIYIFASGYNLYPFSNIFLAAFLSIEICLIFFLCVKGMITAKNRWSLMPFIYMTVLVGIFIVSDPVFGKLSGGIAPRHAAFIWPAFIIAIVLGLSTVTKRYFYIMLCALIMLNGVSLWSRWTRQWSYDSSPDYRFAGRFALSRVISKTAILYDGRSEGPIDFYFPADIPRIRLWGYARQEDISALLRYKRIIVVTNDYRSDMRQAFNKFLKKIEKWFTGADCRVEYPLFEYIFERDKIEKDGYPVDEKTGQIYQPLDIYGLEFQDLRLPVDIKIDDSSLKVVGAFMLPDLEGACELSIPLANPSSCSYVRLLSNVVGLDGLADGQQVAEMAVEDKNGEITVFPLRLGMETQDWSKPAQFGSSLKRVYKWHKRIAFVGYHHYPEAWRDFQAGIYSAAFKMPPRRDIYKIRFRYTAPKGILYIWGLAIK